MIPERPWLDQSVRCGWSTKVPPAPERPVDVRDDPQDVGLRDGIRGMTGCAGPPDSGVLRSAREVAKDKVLAFTELGGAPGHPLVGEWVGDINEPRDIRGFPGPSPVDPDVAVRNRDLAAVNLASMLVRVNELARS